MAAGLNDETVREVDNRAIPLNLALGSSSSVEHLILYRATLVRHSPKRVYYGFFDNQLTEVPAMGWNDLTGNRAMVYYADGDLVRFSGSIDYLLQWRLRAVGLFPVLVERLAIWSKVERIRRFFGAIGLPRRVANRFGAVDDFSQLEASNEAAFARDRANEVVTRTPFAPSVAELLRTVKLRKGAIILVLMPMPKAHRDRYYASKEWGEYFEWISQLARESGAEVIDAADWVDDEGFVDPLHLGSQGAISFSRRLTDIALTMDEAS
jgi:hypothetical protein